jgi:hypothetical protein
MSPANIPAYRKVIIRYGLKFPARRKPQTVSVAQNPALRKAFYENRILLS